MLSLEWLSMSYIAQGAACEYAESGREGETLQRLSRIAFTNVRTYHEHEYARMRAEG